MIGDCPTCAGTGYEPCDECDGDGLCAVCRGARRDEFSGAECEECNGTGVCVCDGGASEEPCEDCDGTGDAGAR